MDYLQALIRRAKLNIFVVILFNNLLLIGSLFIGGAVLELNASGIFILLAVVTFAEATLITTGLGNYLMQPLKALWQTILHLSPDGGNVAAPNPQSLRFGADLVASLDTYIYELIRVADKAQNENRLRGNDLGRNFVAQNLPLPLIVLDASETIKFTNKAAVDYIGIAAADMLGKNVYMVLDMSFPSEDTFDTWLKASKAQSATATKTWERVRLNIRDNHPVRLFDLAAYYNRDNPEKIETMLALFDHTKQYSQDDQAVSFIALTVHELRTPLTLLRGYIEVFQEELQPSATPELQGFMLKMQSQANQLMAFVNNILNVARVDNDQLELRLEETQWPTLLKSTVENLSLQAKVRGITLHCRLQTNLPSVAVDRLSIQEVITNLIDNAIKYSGASRVIEVKSYLTQDGLVETTVQDFGLGISTSVIPNLFTKFYRDHRNRAQIGGTGLGLYLSKAIVTAHGGNLWVRSQEGQGSTFGFTLVPYAQLAEEKKQAGKDGITRGAHGWIKNHSLYRR
ncbi:MAG: ATP-binding protein [Candidatus Saccharimonadales bacterium]